MNRVKRKQLVLTIISAGCDYTLGELKFNSPALPMDLLANECKKHRIGDMLKIIEELKDNEYVFELSEKDNLEKSYAISPKGTVFLEEGGYLKGYIPLYMQILSEIFYIVSVPIKWIITLIIGEWSKLIITCAIGGFLALLAWYIFTQHFPQATSH